MNTLIRLGKFNLVGAMGMVVQLAALALFNRWMAGRYLYASAAAIEITLLHNFVWHWHYTWRDRRDSATPVHRFLRFQLSSGLISMLGNLALMQLLVHGAHLPLLVSNLAAIVCCSLANFSLGNNWAFARIRKLPSGSEIADPKSVYYFPLVLLLFPTICANVSAQTPTPLQAAASSSSLTAIPDVPRPQTTPPSSYHPDPSATYIYHLGAFCGVGASTSPAATKPTVSCGAGMTIVPLPVFIEVGIMAPQANRSSFSGYLSLDTSIPLAPSSSKYLPMAMVGYSRLFETGHALDYGLALALPRLTRHSDNTKSLRIELRDYWTFANPTQHNVLLRVGWMGEEAD
jgi:putative flippase GtrA